MISELRGGGEGEGEGGSLALLTVLALVVGAISGAGVACFMLLLEQADQLRDALLVFAHAQGPEGVWLLVAACAAAAGIAASLVRRISPQAAGSGIPHVEAVLNGQLPQAPFRIIPVKFVGGVLAIGAGLALGREGPSVHMAATLGHLVGKIFRRNWPDCRVLLAAGAGAGLATAFNAPIAGAIFVLEELVRRFELRIAIAALGASASAISVSRAILGDGQDFHLGALVMPDLAIRPLFFVLGALAGVMAVITNRVLLQTMATVDRLDHWPVEIRAALDRGRGWRARLVSSRSRWRRRSDHPADAARRWNAWPASAGFSHEARARFPVLFGGNARRIVCSPAGAWRAIRIVLRIGLSARRSGPACSAGRVRMWWEWPLSSPASCARR